MTAHQLLTGQLPPTIGDPNPTAIRRAPSGRTTVAGPGRDLPDRVDSVLAGGMAADPRARPTSAADLVSRLSAALGIHDPGPGTSWLSAPAPEPGGEALSRLTSVGTATWPRRWSLWGIAIFSAGAVAAAACAAILVLRTDRHVRPRRATAAARGVRLRTINHFVLTRYDYKGAEENPGPRLSASSDVAVSCRVQLGVGGGWAYRIAEAPWDQQYYAAASGFTDRGDDSFDPSVPLCRGFAEIAGNANGTSTWTDYRTAGGRLGPLMPGFRPVQISCRVRGLVVQDGDGWWYRVKQSPWDGRFYATADAFYNDGRTHGSLKGTAFVDLDVPVCNTGGNRTRGRQ